MLRLKLKLDEFEYIEGTPEEVATFMKIVGKQPRMEEATEVKAVEAEKDLKSTTVERTTIKELKNTEGVQINIPTEKEVINYITSKELFEHHTVELQENFLGGRLRVRDNPSGYSAFDNLIRKARKFIASEFNGTWDKTTKSLGGKTHVTLYRFKKSDEQLLNNTTPISVSDESTQPLKSWL
jgi:hypothetical protein